MPAFLYRVIGTKNVGPYTIEGNVKMIMSLLKVLLFWDPSDTQ